jgi:V8-like Glu-specific endopeptidase
MVTEYSSRVKRLKPFKKILTIFLLLSIITVVMLLSLTKINPTAKAAVLGLDDRQLISYPQTQSFPYKSICKLFISWPTYGGGTQGSGCIIGPGQNGHGYHILTAAHNVYQRSKGGYATSIKVITAYDGMQSDFASKTPFNYAWVTKNYTDPGWTTNQLAEDDWAVCTLDRCVGDFTQWMQMGNLPASDVAYSGTVYTAGYPGDKDSAQRMYSASATGGHADETQHWFNLDTSEGQSGSPVWYKDSSNKNIILSVVATTDVYPDHSVNYGPRFSQERVNLINDWLSSDPAPNDKPDLLDGGLSSAGFSPSKISYDGGDEFSVHCLVSNWGTRSSSTFNVDFYASYQDTTISSSDSFLGTSTVSDISAFTSKDVSKTVTFPGGLTYGYYYIGWIIDRTNVISEFDENNNVAYITSPTLDVFLPFRPITFYTEPANIGSIQLDGPSPWTNGQYCNTFYRDGKATITANSPVGWAFSNWVTTGGISISESTATITGSGTIKAVFSKAKVDLTFATDPATRTSITFDGTTYQNGQVGQYYLGTYSATASPQLGWGFLKWVATDGIAAEGSIITVSGPGTLKAVFGPKWNVTFYTSPSNLGAVIFDNMKFLSGEQGQFVAGTHTLATYLPEGYVLDRWSVTGGIVAGWDSATVSTSGTITAVFRPIPWNITFYTDPSDKGSITFSDAIYLNGQKGTFPIGSYPVVANAPSNWDFAGWITNGGVTISGSTATVASSGTIKAVFMPTGSKPLELNITSPTQGSEINSRNVTVSWEGSNSDSGLSAYQIKLDEGDWMDNGISSNYEFAGLNDGNHTVQIKSVDKLGNTKEYATTFSVHQGFTITTQQMYILAGIIATTIAAILLAFWKKGSQVFARSKLQTTGPIVPQEIQTQIQTPPPTEKLQPNNRPAWPDLVVERLNIFSDADRYYTEVKLTTDPLYILLTIKNQGNAPATFEQVPIYHPPGLILKERPTTRPPILFSYELKKNDSILLKGNFELEETPYTIHQGQSSEYIRLNLPPFLSSGDYELKLVVEPDNLIVEANKQNNIKITTFEVVEPASDLIIDDLIIGTGAWGDSGLTIYVKNTGLMTADLRPLKLHGFKDSIMEIIVPSPYAEQNKLEWNPTYEDLIPDFLPLNESFRIYYIYTSINPEKHSTWGGTWIFRLNPKKILPESNYDNNEIKYEM